MKLKDTATISRKDKRLKLLTANKGRYVYYVEYTDEILLSKENFGDGSLFLTISDTEFNLGPVTYIGEL